MRVLIACEESQAVTIAFRELGHKAYSCDILPCSGGHPEWHIQGDAVEVGSRDWDFRIAFPPCTDLAVSGARWFPEKRANGSQRASIEFFLKMLQMCDVVENPIGIMSGGKYLQTHFPEWAMHARRPDQIIQPWQFGHPETKATCLWTREGLSLLQPTNVVEPDFMKKPDGTYYKDAKGKRYSRIHFMSRSNPDRAKMRSKTYSGIAAALAAQYGNL